MKKILYLIPLFLLFLIPKVHALPDCGSISSATLYDVNSSTSVGAISTYSTGGLLCDTIFDATGSSSSSQGLGWSINLSSLNNKNSFYQLDVYMYIDGTGTPAIQNSSFRSNYISVGYSTNPASLWANGNLNVTDLNYSYNTYYSTEYGRTYYVASYIFKSNINFNKIFVPFATSFTYTGGFQLEGIKLTNTGQSSLTSTEINSLLANQSSQIQNDINNMQDSINNNIKDNFNTCEPSYNIFNPNGTLHNGYGISDTGTIITDSTGSYYDTYIPITSNTTYVFSNKYDANMLGSWFIVYYNANKGFIRREQFETTDNYFVFTTPSNSSYFRLYSYYGLANINSLSNIMVAKGSSKKTFQPYGEVCQNKIDETNDKLDDVNSSIGQTNDKLDDLNSSINDSNSSGATNSAGGFFNNFEDNDFGLSGIITAPLNTIKTITNNSCTPLNLTIPFVDKEMSLPCMTDIYEEHFGSFLDIYQIITFGIISYWVCVQIYAMVKGFKNPDKDEIEVMDL